MTVFHIITSFQVGGAEDVALSICKYCRLHNKEMRVIIFEIFKTNNAYAANMKQRAKEAGVEYYTLGTSQKYLSLIIAPFRLLYEVFKKKPAIIHSHTDLPDFVLAVYLKLFSLKNKFRIVRTIQNTELWSTYSKLGKLTESSFKNDYIVSVSEPTRSAYYQLRKRFSLNPSPNHTLIPNGVMERKDEKHPFTLTKEKINIAFIGRLEDQKGIDILLETITKLPADLDSKFSFHIIGNGHYEKEVRELCKTKKNCFYYGIIPLIANKMHAFDFIIMPSRHEGLVMVSLLASMSHVPVIASDVPGLKETLPDNWPLLVKSLNHSDYIQALADIAENKFNIPALKEQAFRFVNDNYSIHKMGDSYMNLYKAAASSAS